MLRVQISHYIWPGLTLKLTIQGHPFSKKNFRQKDPDQTESASSAHNGSKIANLRKLRPSGVYKSQPLRFRGLLPQNPPKSGLGIRFPMQVKMLNISKTVPDSAIVCMVSKKETTSCKFKSVFSFDLSRPWNLHFKVIRFQTYSAHRYMACCGQTVRYKCPYHMGNN